MYKSIFARPEPSMARIWVGFCYLNRSMAQYSSGKKRDDKTYIIVHLHDAIYVFESWDDVATLLNDWHSFCDPQYFDFPESMLPHFVQCLKPANREEVE